MKLIKYLLPSFLLLAACADPGEETLSKPQDSIHAPIKRTVRFSDSLYDVSEFYIAVKVPKNSGIVLVAFESYVISNDTFYVVDNGRCNIDTLSQDQILSRSFIDKQKLDRLKEAVSHCYTIGSVLNPCVDNFIFGWPRFYITIKDKKHSAGGFVANVYRKKIYDIIDALNEIRPSLGYDKQELINREKECLEKGKISYKEPEKQELKESFKEEDLPVNEYLTEKLKPIRANFKRINTTSKWDSIVTKDLHASAEGGDARYYYHGSVLEKIVTRHFGETGQALTEYYFFESELSFIFDKRIDYPTNYDWGPNEPLETKSYFIKGKLVHQLFSQDCGAPQAGDYLLEEEKRLMKEWGALRKR